MTILLRYIRFKNKPQIGWPKAKPTLKSIVNKTWSPQKSCECFFSKDYLGCTNFIKRIAIQLNAIKGGILLMKQHIIYKIYFSIFLDRISCNFYLDCTESVSFFFNDSLLGSLFVSFCTFDLCDFLLLKTDQSSLFT